MSQNCKLINHFFRRNVFCILILIEGEKGNRNFKKLMQEVLTSETDYVFHERWQLTSLQNSKNIWAQVNRNMCKCMQKYNTWQNQLDNKMKWMESISNSQTCRIEKLDYNTTFKGVCLYLRSWLFVRRSNLPEAGPWTFEWRHQPEQKHWFGPGHRLWKIPDRNTRNTETEREKWDKRYRGREREKETEVAVKK